MAAIRGIVRVECFVDGKIESYYLRDENDENILIIPEGVANRIINESREEAILINLPDRAWHPQDEDTIKFKDWEEYVSLRC